MARSIENLSQSAIQGGHCSNVKKSLNSDKVSGHCNKTGNQSVQSYRKLLQQRKEFASFGDIHMHTKSIG